MTPAAALRTTCSAGPAMTRRRGRQRQCSRAPERSCCSAGAHRTWGHAGTHRGGGSRAAKRPRWRTRRQAHRPLGVRPWPDPRHLPAAALQAGVRDAGGLYQCGEPPADQRQLRDSRGPRGAASVCRGEIQISIKAKLAEGLLFGYGDVWAGYTQSSRWQVYNAEISRPFRETNCEPEAMLVFGTDYHLLGLHGRMLGLSLNHPSNGRGQPLVAQLEPVDRDGGLRRGRLDAGVPALVARSGIGGRRRQPGHR